MAFERRRDSGTSASFSMDDPAIQKTVALLPPSPSNTLPDFLHGVVSGDIKPALCHSEILIDAPRYWETRRVQNSLRRVLESLQERFNILAGDAPASELGGIVYDEMLLLAQRSHLACVPGKAPDRLDEVAFVQGLEVLGAWPPELTRADRSEVFAALCTPTIAIVRGLSTGGQLENQLSRRRFGEGLARVPFNVPDFPVPTHLLQAGIAHEASRVAAAIAAVFCLPDGLEGVNDFFACGLLSLEEIQVSLPFLVPETLIEEAAVRIIRAGAEHLTQREWQDLIIGVRMGPAGPETSADVAYEQPVQLKQHEQMPVSLESPAPQYRQVPEPEPAKRDRENGLPFAFASSGSAEGFKSTVGAEETATLGQYEPKLPPMTEPLLCREIRSEAPVQFYIGNRVINWSATRRVGDSQTGGLIGLDSLGRDPRHPADESAWNGITNQEGRELDTGAVASSNQEQACSDDPVRLISLDMHNECIGPFLAIAFVRCCQVYEVSQSGSTLLGSSRFA